MASRFKRGLECVAPNIPMTEKAVEKDCSNEELLIWALLFVLLAASPALGLESRYFFIIIMAALGLGGIDKAFGLKK